MTDLLLAKMKKAEESGGHFMLSLAELRDVIDALSSAPQPQPIDVEKLKREVYAQEFVRHCECDSDLISCAIDHLAANYDFVRKV